MTDSFAQGMSEGEVGMANEKDVDTLKSAGAGAVKDKDEAKADGAKVDEAKAGEAKADEPKK